MAVVLLACGLLIAVAVAWGVHRHRLAEAWDRELELAFGVGEQRELPLHRVL